MLRIGRNSDTAGSSMNIDNVTDVSGIDARIIGLFGRSRGGRSETFKRDENGIPLEMGEPSCVRGTFNGGVEFWVEVVIRNIVHF